LEGKDGLTTRILRSQGDATELGYPPTWLALANAAANEVGLPEVTAQAAEPQLLQMAIVVLRIVNDFLPGCDPRSGSESCS
jgi:hypothetical protein